MKCGLLDTLLSIYPINIYLEYYTHIDIGFGCLEITNTHTLLQSNSFNISVFKIYSKETLSAKNIIILIKTDTRKKTVKLSTQV